ncbi:hypothetical protein Tco_1555067 [Tanacetum coccineum]
MPVQTRRQLATDPEMCISQLTVSIVEPKNIKEAMADSAWIKAMQMNFIKGFVDPDHPEKVYLLRKALYGLKQAPRATEYQLADMFTKALPEDRFKYLVRRIGMRCLTPAELEVLTNETA